MVGVSDDGRYRVVERRWWGWPLCGQAIREEHEDVSDMDGNG